MVNNSPVNAEAGDAGSVLGSGKSPGEGNVNLLQYSFFFFLHFIFLHSVSLFFKFFKLIYYFTLQYYIGFSIH